MNFILIKHRKYYKKKRINNNNNKYYKSIIFKMFIFINIIFIFTISNSNHFALKNIYEETNNKLNLMKKKFQNDTFIKPYIQNISVISHYKSHLRNTIKI